MCFVAFLAVAGDLLSGVRLVALGTLRNLAMNVVAERAVELGMLARISPELCYLRRVAGKTWIGYVATEDDLFRLMRIPVALETAAKFIVGFALVTLAAEWNDFPVCRRVTIVAILTGHLCFVGSTFGCNVSRCFCVALDTVSAGEGNCRLCSCCLRSCRF